MIQAKDLRLGNSIYHHWWRKLGKKIHAEVGTVTQISKKSFTVDNHIPGRGPWNVRGIPLDGDWFEMFGFEMDHGDWTLGGIRIGQHEEWEDEATFRLTIHEWISYGGTGIQYVHQLQNLFYALTGEELSYKP